MNDDDAMIRDLIAQQGAPTVPEKCPDGGACHHGCGDKCWRVRYTGPLSNVFPGDDWPQMVKAEHAPSSPEVTG